MNSGIPRFWLQDLRGLGKGHAFCMAWTHQSSIQRSEPKRAVLQAVSKEALKMTRPGYLKGWPCEKRVEFSTRCHQGGALYDLAIFQSIFRTEIQYQQARKLSDGVGL